MISTEILQIIYLGMYRFILDIEKFTPASNNSFARTELQIVRWRRRNTNNNNDE